MLSRLVARQSLLPRANLSSSTIKGRIEKEVASVGKSAGPRPDSVLRIEDKFFTNLLRNEHQQKVLSRKLGVPLNFIQRYAQVVTETNIATGIVDPARLEGAPSEMVADAMKVIEKQLSETYI